MSVDGRWDRVRTGARRASGFYRAVVTAFMLLSLLVTAQAAETVTYYYTSPLGTVLATADGAGNVLGSSDYRPYGSQALGTPEQGPGYTGHVNDVDSGYVYMQARYYDPAVARFISTDPVGPASGNPFNFNRYDYASNNPIVNIDPTGKAACPGEKASVCIQADVTDPSRLSGRNVVATEAVASAMVAGKALIAVRKTDLREEKVGFVLPKSDGSSEVVRATNVSTTSEAGRDTATANAPAGAQAIIHGHIDGKSDGVVSDTKTLGDFSAVSKGLPNAVVSNGRVGVNELVNGVPQLRMLQGTMSPHEIQASQANLNRVLKDFENTAGGSGQ
ncbi:RHS repeat-associated protein [Luteibacter sp. Sphag1AF]|uniref:RHS repeat-associated core domain-containing protein n=1 Tax=Luteibacter sp. Sphag1AF TaxID=2587031 RepID=UPI0016107821|nr:RHS repeat-associated core domain-containing protein [Luteibacter sp. Sphag1AF]MBB3227128.1 RHS repeat-associated protein [Luteibacter sp. Sphag1AF]